MATLPEAKLGIVAVLREHDEPRCGDVGGR